MNNKLNNLKRLRDEINLIVEGRDNFPTDKPAVIITNHNCLKDVFYLPLGLPSEMVSLISARLIYKNDIKRQEVVNKYLYSMPIEAHGKTAYSNMCLNAATNLLCNNINLNIFPEGAYIDDKEHVYKGRTGASRILYSARENGVDANIIPIAIDVRQKGNNLDNFDFSRDDEVTIKILEPINYDEYFYQYVNSNNRNEKNEALHLVIDEGMRSIATALRREYVDEYIELFPKGNVIFRNGDQVDTQIAQREEFIKRYLNEINERSKQIEKQLTLTRR